MLEVYDEVIPFDWTFECNMKVPFRFAVGVSVAAGSIVLLLTALTIFNIWLVFIRGAKKEKLRFNLIPSRNSKLSGDKEPLASTIISLEY
jgi:hypothetical protein